MRSTDHGLRTKVRSVLLVTIMVLASVGHAGVVGADHTSPPPADEVFEATDSIDVWDRAILPLRVDKSNAAMTVENADWRIRTTTGETSLNDAGTDPVGVYSPGTPVSVNFDVGSTDLSSNAFDGENVQFVAARLDESGETPTPETVSDAMDLFTQENVNGNATFSDVVTKEVSSGTASFEYTPSKAGTYVFFLATTHSSGAGFEVTGGDISVDGDVTIVGVEQMLVQKATSDVKPRQTSVTRGSDVVFDTDATELAGDTVSHLVVLYDEEKFIKQEFIINVSEEPNRDFDIQNNSTLVHSINHVNGVARLEEGLTINGIDVSDGNVTGSPDVGSVLDFIAENANTSVPENEPDGTAVLNASATGISGTPVESLTVETRDDWSAGSYRWIHVAVDEDSGDVATSDGTVQIAESGSDFDSLEVTSFSLSKSSVKSGNKVTATATIRNPTDTTITQYYGIRKFEKGSTAIAGQYGPKLITLGPKMSEEVDFVLDTTGGTWKATTYNVEFFVSSRNSVTDPIDDSKVRELTVTDGTSGGGSPGGGSPGGGGSTGPPPVYSEVTPTDDGGAEIAINNGRAGEVSRTGLSGVSANGVSFDQLDVEFSQDVSEMDLEITPSASAPSGTPALPSGASSISFLVVSHSDNVDDSVGQATFRFTVDESQLPDDATLDDVALYRYNSGEWTKLETSRTGENSFAAISPGFSVFAVGVDSGEADISVTDAAVSSSTVDIGDSVTVTATLENAGEQEGSFTAELTVDGTVVAEQEATVPAGETVEVEFTHIFDEAGTYDLAVSDVTAGTVTVQSDDVGTATPTPTPPTEEGGLGLSAIVVLILLAAALVAGAGYYLRREGHI